MKTYPGMTVELSRYEIGSSRALFEGLFAAGGLTLSQICNMTGLEPYMIQNWVKRKYVSSPQKKLYSKEQFARIVILNMLREVLPLESIAHLVCTLSGESEHCNVKMMQDDELYYRYTDLLVDQEGEIFDWSAARERVLRVAEEFENAPPGAKRALEKILEAMLYAYASAQLRDRSVELLNSLR
ncbi:MAG: DUF1836 domain-containing protein [Clostridia bacterium]|nr:DUF1836 domain-containing protein [Clostridia bacterium]